MLSLRHHETPIPHFDNPARYDNPAAMKIGLDLLATEEKHLLKGKRIGLLYHAASLDSGGVSILDRFHPGENWEVTSLFGPEHGIDMTAQDMEPVASTTHAKTGLPFFSLYGSDAKSLRPKKYMLDNIDTLVIDLQDIGSRYYTYIWTTIHCMEACAKQKKEVILCDRPNPINGVDVEGEINEKEFSSFVGLYPLPVRHGMTIGEIARYVNDVYDLGCDLKVVSMAGWNRNHYLDETGLRWNNPSPNMRGLHEAILYPGLCLLEATNISEGRGTERPFQVFGAPFVKARELIDLLQEGSSLPGVSFSPTEFTPKMQKWAKQLCQGIRLEITDRGTFRPYATGIAIIRALHQAHEKEFQWRMEPYEFVDDVPAIDLLTGSTTVRIGVEKHLPLAEILEWVGAPSASFLRQTRPYLLY